MNSIAGKSQRKSGFTIVELLTIMAIIVTLISLLVPALNRVKRYAKRVKQKAQFYSISVSMDLFNAEWDGYPDSDAVDEDGNPYCGAMKLCEAMVGMDFKGLHPASRFCIGDKDTLYPPKDMPDPVTYAQNLKSRKAYLQLENANANKIKHIYSVVGEEVVLCDVYGRVRLVDPIDPNIGGKTGMPILYYKADTAKTKHEYTPGNNSVNIYNCEDNQLLIDLGMPWSAFVHPMTSTGGNTSTGAPPSPGIFYDKTLNEKISTLDRPYRADSYILLSAGFDGEYGTDDDVFNFGD